MRVNKYRIDLHGYGENPDYFWCVQISRKNESWTLRSESINPVFPDTWKKYHDTGVAINDALLTIADIERSTNE
jgi:hypothetical protein